MNRYLGDLVEGRAQYRRALALMEQARGATSPDYAAILHNLAVLDYQDGKLEQAARQFHGALQIRQAVLGEKDTITAQTPDSWIGHFGDVSRLFPKSRSWLAIAATSSSRTSRATDGQTANLESNR